MYSDLPYLWSLFQRAISLCTPSTEQGYTLEGFKLFFSSGEKIDIPVSPERFWKIMGYFLRRQNYKWFKDVQKKREKLKNGR